MKSSLTICMPRGANRFPRMHLTRSGSGVVKVRQSVLMLCSHTCFVFLAYFGVFLYAPACSAEAYPSRPIHLIVPFAPGQVTDWLARFVGEKMAQQLGQPVVVENRPGVSGTVGTAYAVRQPADGYTLVVTSNGTHSAAPFLYKNVSYDPVDDFAHISALMNLPWVLMVNPDLPVNSFRDFINYARTNPGKLAAGYGSSSSQLCVHLLHTLGNIDILSIPYKSLGQTTVDLISGRLQFNFLDIGSAISQANGGALRPLATTSPQRAKALPQLPTIAETLPGYQMVSWLGLAAPAGTDPAIIRRLHDVVQGILNEPETKEKIAAYGGETMDQDGEGVVGMIESESLTWKRFAKEAGINKE